MINITPNGFSYLSNITFAKAKETILFSCTMILTSILFISCAEHSQNKQALQSTTNLNPEHQAQATAVNEKMKKKQIWIDADLAVGMQKGTPKRYCDVDDGYAILQLLKSDKVKIHGISSVYGNTNLENATMLCNKMSSEFTDENIPVYKGAGKPIELADVKINDAVEAMAAALKKQKLTILALGPGTNVGLLLLNFPELKEQIKEVVLVAGRRDETAYFDIGTKGRRAGDANFDKDPTSFRLMFQHQVPVTLCPFEISHKVWLKDKDLNKLSQNSDGAQWLAEHSEPWLAQWKEQGADGFNPFDILASHYIIQPQDIISEPLNARLEIHHNDTQPNNDKSYKHYLICDKEEGYPVRYCYDVSENYHDIMMKSLLK